MTLRIYNTLSRETKLFEPLESNSNHVRMYVCGITVYDLCHVGHARMMMSFDVVYRWLQQQGYRVDYVRNITDIDDKIIRRALERGMPIRQLTEEMIAAMHQDMGALGILAPTHEPRATEYVPEMLAMIRTLEQKGLAYRSESGDVNYAVRKFEGYGKLSGKSIDQLRAGERVAVLDGKQDPLDFVLWKAAKESEPEDAKWASDFGPGRPGWHIECSAMACSLLGQSFDIHGGGMDLQFPHHENEIAQSEGANGQPFARFWMHNGFVNVDNVKMSKSLGNFFTLREVLQRYDGETIRFFFLRTHYRSPFNFSDVHLDDARNSLRRLYTALDLAGELADGEAAAPDWSEPTSAAFKAAMDDDFNTPIAVSLLFELANGLNAFNLRRNEPQFRERVRETAGVLKSLASTLGLLQQPPRDFLQAGSSLDEDYIAQQIAERDAAKQRRDFVRADAIRNVLAGEGIRLLDSPKGTTWVKA